MYPNNVINTNTIFYQHLATALDHCDDYVDSNVFLDSSTSRHYLQVNAPMQGMTRMHDIFSIKLANRDNICSTNRGFLPIQNLLPAARQGEVLPGLTMSSLISVSQFCNNGCEVSFTDVAATVTKMENVFS